MSISKKIKRQIMRKVYAIRMLRSCIKPTVLKAYALVVASIYLPHFVSFVDVFHNLSGVNGFSSYYSFFYSAVANTEVTALALTIFASIFILWIIKDIAIKPEQHSVLA